MKFLFLLFLMIFTAITHAQGQEKNHYLFLVHGIGGSAQTFGSLPRALTHHLDQAKPGTRHETFSFVYPTSNKTMSPDDFAVLFGEFIHLKLKDRIQEGDKISIVSHSQGGLVSLIWYFHAYLQHNQLGANLLPPEGRVHNQDQNFHSEYIPYMDAMISLGTPYWGSKLASILTEDNWMARALQKRFFTQLGRRQLLEMALTSETIGRFRKNVTSIPNPVLLEMGKKIRPLNIAGAADIVEIFRDKTRGWSQHLKAFKNFVFGGRYYESDAAVPLPSARFDSIYTVDQIENYMPGQVTSLKHTQQTQFAPLLIVNSLHASPLPKEIPDMVEVPEACVQSLGCKHPTFQYVYEHILGKPLPAHGPGVHREYLSGFMVSFRVSLPKSVNAKRKYIDIRLVDPKPNNDFQFVIADPKEVLSQAAFVHPSNPHVLVRTDSGRIEYRNLNSEASQLVRRDGAKATFLIQARGFKPRYIETILKSTYTTFINVNLEPN